MFDIRKPYTKPVTVIRQASCKELAAYEQRKLESGYLGARKDFMALVNPKISIDSQNKEVRIEIDV